MFPKSRTLQDICLDIRMEADITMARFAMESQKIMSRVLTKRERKLVKVWERVKKAVRYKLGLD